LVNFLQQKTMLMMTIRMMIIVTTVVNVMGVSTAITVCNSM